MNVPSASGAAAVIQINPWIEIVHDGCACCINHVMCIYNQTDVKWLHARVNHPSISHIICGFHDGMTEHGSCLLLHFPPSFPSHSP